MTCPWCGATDVERVAEFGAELLVSPYFCRRCRSPFQAIRKRGDEASGPPPAPGG